MALERFNYRKIIHEAWVFTQQHRTLMLWYSFFPSILTTLMGILYLSYQFFAFKRSPLFENAKESFLHEIVSKGTSFFLAHKPFIVPSALIAIIIIVGYLLLPTLCQGGLVQIIARLRKGIEARPIEGISLGLLVFLPLFEFHLFVRTFSLFAVLTETSFVVRNLGVEAFRLMTPIFIVVALVGFILTLLFTYTEFFIILERKKVLSSIGNSCKLVILNWQHTFLIGILMLIIGLRIILNLVAILLVPALIVFSAGFVATIALAKTGIIIGTIIGLIGLLFVAYFNGILNMFANTVWTFTFLALREEAKAKEFIA